MRKSIRIILVLALSLLLSGCKETEHLPEEQTNQQEEILYNLSTDMAWQDNSLDAYSANFILPVRYTEQENAIQGGTEQYVIGKESAAVFKKHLFSEVDDCWDEINVIDDKGEEKSFRLAFWNNLRNQAWAIGNTYNGEGYWLMNVEMDTNNSLLYLFFRVDENMNVQQSFYVDEIDREHYEIPYQILEDAEGNIHALTTISVENKLYHNYYIISSKGVIINKIRKEAQERREPELFYLYDGRVGICIGKELLLAEEEYGKTEFYVELEPECSKFMFLDKNTLIYADTVGLHRCSISGGKPEVIYAWENHGIVFSMIHALRLLDNQQIGLLYESQGEVRYVKLEPTTDQISVTEIEFAVTGLSFQKYQSVVAEFNRMHPTYQVKMKQYSWNDMGLLTELIAGEGPQLLDSGVTGFADHVEWWAPLDGFYEQLNLETELFPQTVEIGKIDGKIYGVVTDFYIYTMVTFSETPDDWNYETFLDYLTERYGEGKAYINGLNGSDGLTFLGIFYHGLNENFLYEAESGETHFDGEYFQKMLQLAKRYDQKDNQANMEDLKKKEAPCAVIAIYNPEDLACLRIWGEEQLRFVGFPSQSGAVHYLAGADPLCVRKNATAEEKQIALSFLSFLLSYDVQKELAVISGNPNIHLSVRPDILDAQMNQMNAYSYPYVSGIPQFFLGDKVDIDKDHETLMELLKEARPKIYAPKELSNILREEFSGYLNGGISETELKNHLKKRVELYFKERK